MEKCSIKESLAILDNSKANNTEEYVLLIEKIFKVNINIHDVIGVSSLTPSLEKVFSLHQYHNNSFCNHVKKNHRCLELCILNKAKLCSKCKKVSTPFYDSCYMGIEELIYPVVCDKKLIAIICIGQFSTSINTSKAILEKNTVLHNFKKEEIEMYFDMVIKNFDLNIETLNCYISILIEHICMHFKLSLENKIHTKLRNQGNTDILDIHKSNFIINNTTQFIKDNYEKALTLDILASNSYCNPTYLSHTFKEKMKISLTQYINNIRVQKAKELIDVTNKSITEICMRVGFNDLGYFGRVFKSIIGISPREYREKNT